MCEGSARCAALPFHCLWLCAVRGMFGERGGRGDTVRVSTSYLDYDGMCINAPEGCRGMLAGRTLPPRRLFGHGLVSSFWVWTLEGVNNAQQARLARR